MHNETNQDLENTQIQCGHITQQICFKHQCIHVHIYIYV
jgi:hypothetical protein